MADATVFIVSLLMTIVALIWGFIYLRSRSRRSLPKLRNGFSAVQAATTDDQGKSTNEDAKSSSATSKPERWPTGLFYTTSVSGLIFPIVIVTSIAPVYSPHQPTMYQNQVVTRSVFRRWVRKDRDSLWDISNLKRLVKPLPQFCWDGALPTSWLRCFRNCRYYYVIKHL